MSDAPQTAKTILNASLSTPGIFKNTIDGIKDLVKDVNFDFNESGLQVQTTDSSNVALVHLKMNESAFTEYSCTQNITIGMNAESLGKVMKLCGQTDRLIMQATDDEYITFRFASTTEDRVAEFKMKSVTVESEALAVPDSEYEVVANVPSVDFKKAVAELKDVGDHMSITANTEGLKLEVTGDMGTGFVLLKPKDNGSDDGHKLEVTGEKSLTLSVGMRYLNLFTRATTLNSSLTINMSEGEPIMFHYPLSEETHGFLRFLLAPKMDD
jgi:proliferating cell nuclear antigen